jgi:hypothetical protein
VQTTAEEFLQVADRVLVHRIDVIDSAQLFNTKTTAAGTAALFAEQEQKPLVPDFPPVAFPALQDGMVDKPLADRTAKPYKLTSATHAVPHVFKLSAISFQLSAKLVIYNTK